MNEPSSHRKLSSAGTVLITGGARRLGAAMALELARAGWDVVVHYRSSSAEAAALAQSVEELGRRAFTLEADLEVARDCAALVPRAAEMSGQVHALINSASIFPNSTVLDFTPEDLARCVQVHVTAPTLLARAMWTRKEARHILNLLDSKITGPDQEHAAYHLSKRMLATLTRMLALEFAPRIAVNAIAPGAMLPAAGADATRFESLADTIPMGKTGRPGDVARAARYILESEFVTGQVLFVDGGRHMQGSLYG